MKEQHQKLAKGDIPYWYYNNNQTTKGTTWALSRVPTTSKIFTT